MKIKRWTYLLIGLLILSFVGLKIAKNFNYKSNFSIGQQIDSLNGVFVYYNGGYYGLICATHFGVFVPVISVQMMPL